MKISNKADKFKRKTTRIHAINRAVNALALKLTIESTLNLYSIKIVV